MKKLTIIFIRDNKNNPVQIRIPSIFPALFLPIFKIGRFASSFSSTYLALIPSRKSAKKRNKYIF